MSTLSQHDGLPASIHMEKTILGSALQYPEALADALTLQESHLYLPSHKVIFRAIASLHAAGEHVDSSTVRERLIQKRELDSIGGFAYLLSLEEGIPRNFNVEGYCKVVRAKSMLRDFLGIAQDIQERASEPDADPLTVLADIEQRLAEVADSSIQKGLSGIAEIASNGFQIDQVHTEGLKTQFTEFDRMTHGLQDSELIILAARPSMGKTALALNIAKNIALRDKVVAFFSLEMSKETLLRRLLSGAPDRKARLERLMDTKLFIDETPGISLAEMRAKARRLKQQEGLDLIMVDYLQLMTGKGENRTQEVSALSRGLKGLAKELQVPLIALSQLSRATEQRADKRPMLSDLRESGAIEQDADVVAFIHREGYYDRANAEIQGTAQIDIAKQRNGPTGTFDLVWIGAYTTFENA
jgi:replicative DNA helicase